MPTPSSPSPLLPPQAQHASTTRRRRRLLASTHPSSSSAPASAAASSSSSYSSSSSSNPPFFSPAPSPFHHRFLSPLRASAVPFSWEHRPGIPKTPARAPRGAKPLGLGPGAKPSPPPLPLPPSLFSTTSNRVVAEYDYPVSVVGPEKKARRRSRRTPQRRWPAVTDALGDWLAVLNFYRSCTRSRDCLAPAGPPPRPRPRAPA